MIIIMRLIHTEAVLWIQLILMRIRILDPHWKKMDPDPDPGYLRNFLTKQNFFLQFLVDILPLGSGDPHIFADPDPGSQNHADQTDPDPKHCLKPSKTMSYFLFENS